MVTEQHYQLGTLARVGYVVLGVLLCVILITFPLGLLFIWLTLRARVSVSDTGFAGRVLLFDTSFEFDEVKKIGLLEDNVQGLWLLFWEDKAGTTHRMPLQAFDSPDDITYEVVSRSGKPLYLVEFDWLQQAYWTENTIDSLHTTGKPTRYFPSAGGDRRAA